VRKVERGRGGEQGKRKGKVVPPPGPVFFKPGFRVSVLLGERYHIRFALWPAQTVEIFGNIFFAQSYSLETWHWQFVLKFWENPKWF